ncbi:hypothetical protein VNI00_013631 [Paramarasmius palmivorus]|uniref:Uncharacterized protein n=1 Tax=Paramarasmius palmivorus TaxID=297713 RepID=A0AAW0BWS1_9AGAR
MARRPSIADSTIGNQNLLPRPSKSLPPAIEDSASSVDEDGWTVVQARRRKRRPSIQHRL